jgi:hypothetical protein
MAQIIRTGASWNRDWVAGEHGGESFNTTDAIVDVVNPQQTKVEKVFVGGSRGFADYDAVTTRIASLRKGSVVLVSPTHGATAAARHAALKLGLEMRVYMARFEKYPTAEAAYFARDEEIIRDSDRVVVFWNGCSPGTGHEIEYAKAICKPIEVCMVDERVAPARNQLGEIQPTFDGGAHPPRAAPTPASPAGGNRLALFARDGRANGLQLRRSDGRWWNLPGAAADSAEGPLASTEGGIGQLTVTAAQAHSPASIVATARARTNIRLDSTGACAQTRRGRAEHPFDSCTISRPTSYLFRIERSFSSLGGNVPAGFGVRAL